MCIDQLYFIQVNSYEIITKKCEIKRAGERERKKLQKRRRRDNERDRETEKEGNEKKKQREEIVNHVFSIHNVTII